MNSFTRKIILREIKHFKLERKFSVSVALRKNDEFLIRSPLADIEVPNERFIDRLWKNIDGYKDNIALVSAETKKAYTYSQLQRNTATFATSLLKKLALKPGDVVATMLPNCPEFPVVFFGTLQAGCVLTTVNPIYKEYEINHQITLTEPKIIITIPECYGNILKGITNYKHSVKIIFVDTPTTHVPDGVIKYSEIAETGEIDYSLLDKIERKPDDVACIPFSSGTTGLPKGVEISHKNLLAGMATMAVEETNYAKLAHGDHHDTLPCFLPFFHIYGMVITLLGHLTLGCKLITMGKFSASVYLDLLKTQPISLLYIVPPVAILLGKHPDVTAEQFRDVRHIVCGAAPLAASDVDAILLKSKVHYVTYIGYAIHVHCWTLTFLIDLQGLIMSGGYHTHHGSASAVRDVETRKTLLPIIRRYPLAGSYCIHGQERSANILLQGPHGNKEIEFNQGFGATETTSLATSTFKRTKDVDYSACGQPMAGVTLKFIDPATGQTVPVGQSGEMCVKSHTIMKGYHKNPQATADSMDDGFFKTGDLGHYSPSKGLFITDRIKELIKVKGMQVAPAELESILRSHPAVSDAAVIGVPHEFFGEAPKAFIIRKPGQTTTEEEFQDFVASKVAGYKKIEEVMFVNDIPKTASGKILRKDLKKIYA